MSQVNVALALIIFRRLSPDQKWSVPLYSACRLNDQTLRALAEAPAQRPADDPYAWDHRADIYLAEVKRFLFNVLLFLGSLPEVYEPDQVLQAAREKKGHLRPGLRAARFLGKETYRPASGPRGAEHQPTRAEITGPLAPASLRGRELAAKADLDPTLQDGRLDA